jgi:NAD(P)-dependent dehydrogenase (short-subunit alcohol dehydrogenase family)
VVGTLRNDEARARLNAFKPGLAIGRILDVTDTAAIEPLVDEIERAVGPIDGLVNNAGYGHEGLMLDDAARSVRSRARSRSDDRPADGRAASGICDRLRRSAGR